MVLEQITKQYSPWFHRAVTTFSLLKKNTKGFLHLLGFSSLQFRTDHISFSVTIIMNGIMYPTALNLLTPILPTIRLCST